MSQWKLKKKFRYVLLGRRMTSIVNSYSLITMLFLLDTSSIELRFHFLFHSLGSDGDTNFSFFFVV